MGEAPSRAVTFLFTDVEGSTRLWQQAPDEMAEALARHDDLLRQAIRDGDGQVFSTAGDAFAAAFPTAPLAVDAAVAAQRALEGEPWPDGVRIRVRMGIHTGAAVERGGDYFGSTLNLGARVMSAGHGGQVLLTAATHRLLDGTPTTIDLGEHSLRDIDGAERLYQVVADGMATEFPAIRALAGTSSRLPTQRSSLIGREEDVGKVRERLRAGRLVTLTGSGGCGKTRLAIEVGARESEAFPDGVFFVDLAKVGDDDAVPDAFADGIDFVPDSGVPIPEQLRRRIEGKSVLIVVDNCEHVLDAAADRIDDLLSRCPNLRVLVTSREALDLDGELVVRVQSLGADLQSGDSPAVRLFLERATDAGAVIEPGDDTTIAALCTRLDGLPLAIELAAARTTVLSPAQILERLDDRFTLLTGGRRRTRGRQQTLEAAIDWSYDLLTAEEQDALCRISVMPAAFDLRLAGAVIGATPAEAVDLLETLTARSLVNAERDGRTDEVRYRLLETIRVYAYQRLVDRECAEATRDRHALHVAERLEAIPGMPNSMLTEHYVLADDVLMAVEWTHARDDLVPGARLVSGAHPIFIGRGQIERGKELHAWAATIDDPVTRSRVFMTRAGLAIAHGRFGEPSHYAQRALDAVDDRVVPWRAQAHLTQALEQLFVDPTATDVSLDMAQAALEPGARTEVAILELWRADLALWRRDYLAALAASDRGVRAGTEDPLSLMNVHGVDLLVRMLLDDHDLIGRHLADPAVEALRRSWLDGAQRGENWLLSYEAIRGAARGQVGEPEAARQDLADALALVTTDFMAGVHEDFLGAFAWVGLACDERERAVEMLEETFSSARSPNTLLLLTEAQERARGISDVTIESRTAELFRRSEHFDAIRSERRALYMLDDELARLHLR